MEYDLGRGSASRSDCPFLPRCKWPPTKRLLLFYLLIALVVVIAVLLILLMGMVFQAFLLVQHPIDKPIWQRDNKNMSLTPQMIDNLQKAIRITTVSSGYKTYNVGALDDFERFLKRAFPRIHSSIWVTQEKVLTYSLLYKVEGSEPSWDMYVLCAHIDVVPADERDSNQKRLWKVHPFSGEDKDGAIWGRGALDNKGSLMAIMEVLEDMLRHGQQPVRGFYMAFSHDQEVNGDGMVEIVRKLSRRKFHPMFVLDEGSSVLNGYLPGTDKQVGVIAVTEKGYLELKVKTKAKGGSASAPSTEKSAIGRLAQALYWIEYTWFPTHLKDSVTRQMFEYLAPHMDFGTRLVMSNLWLLWPVVSLFLSSEATTNAQIRTTTALTQIGGGNKANVLPSEAFAYMNIRIMPGDTEESVRKAIEWRVGDPEVEFEKYGRTSDSPDTSYFSEQTYGYQLLKSMIHHTFPDTLVIPGMTVHATDSRHFHDICPQVYRFVPLVRDKSKPPLMHGHDERITKYEYERMINFYYQIIMGANEHYIPKYITN